MHSPLLFSQRANAAAGEVQAMITFIDMGPAPTVHLMLRVPVALSGGGWTWGTYDPLGDILGKEYAYSAGEVCALVHSYGRVIPNLLPSKVVERFSIVAKGPITGRMIGMREWQFSGMRGVFEPVGEYMCGFRAAARALFEATGTLIDRMTFEAESAPFSVMPAPVSFAA